LDGRARVGMNGTYSDGAFYFNQGFAGTSRMAHFADAWFFAESLYPPDFHDMAFELSFAQPVPEPSMFPLLITGLLGALYNDRRRRKRACRTGIVASAALRLAHRVRHLGDAYYYAGRWALAEPRYVEALSIYRGDNQTRPLDLANAVRSLAVLKHEGGASDEARRLWQEAPDLYTALLTRCLTTRCTGPAL